MDLGLTGKRVLITAGAAGIGMEMARAFAAEGAQVRICDIDATAVEALEPSASIEGAVCDVSDRAAVERFVSDAVASLGGLDVLVNNAGIGGPTSAMADIAPEAWQQVIAINLLGTFNVTQCALPHLKKSAAGSIIVMSSLAGRFGYVNRSAYATSKWGLVGLTKTLSIELGGDGLRVNAILPGGVNGDRFQAVLQGRAQASGRTVEHEAEHAMRNQSIKKLVEPRQIAALACFLASDHAATISGQTFPIDGDAQSI
jgi:NAD(P)-dependent dehydrogenase (short-subunit alcohol dehydrogenase family)